MGLRRNCPWNAARNRRVCKGKTYEEMYGEEKGKALRRAALARGVQQAELLAGLTYEERYGVERALEIRRRISDAIRRKQHLNHPKTDYRDDIMRLAPALPKIARHLRGQLITSSSRAAFTSQSMTRRKRLNELRNTR